MKKIEKTLTSSMNSLADFIGHPKVFVSIVALLVLWFIARILFEYETWFDIMDVAIFIASFLMLFIVQSSQNADTKAMQDKLDEIIDSLPRADSSKKAEEEQIKQGEKS